MRVGLCFRRRAVAASGVGLKSPARLGMKVVWFFWERFLFFLPREALFLLPRAICYPQAREKNGGACIMTYSGSGRGTSTLNLPSGYFLLLSDRGEGAPFQSFS